MKRRDKALNITEERKKGSKSGSGSVAEEVYESHIMDDEEFEMISSELVKDLSETVQRTHIGKRVRHRSKPRTIAKKTVLFLIALIFASSFLMPTILTITNSFMGTSEIASNYGMIFDQFSAQNTNDYGMDIPQTTYIAKKINLKFIPDIVTFSQYITVLFKSPDYLIKFWNSVILTFPIVIFQILVALGASYSFTRFRRKRKEVLFFLYVVLMLMPFQVTLVPNYLVADWLGILDTNWAIWLPGFFTPFSVYILTKYMRRIPNSLIEAAKLDGANEWQIFTRVSVPLCKEAIASVAILVFIDYWNMVEQPLILLSDKEKYPLSVFLSQINTGDVGVAFAVSTIYMVPTILMFLFGEEYLVQGISYQGGVKG
ncbi:MAG: carbohydrate ABC transporter permease [Lachnospiraceae bacterium]|jgi:multiple sugar transport system permease protein|nr:carbohydrate ABC transporter permease [Lachnospiraceae bacterium]MEE3461921.1 carbohydrate ABC transporter permease [Lachnospiraceae bacterium]